ncbi:hypothetical protein JKP88DRAFT_289976 [Tribonema minus]|uniref:Uncharacterized protein n=1 Tax=Tribonema minus TaxID=303371 RepID=A0A835YZI3_9STRA|nr:hypothetical protein JKP88DRAFT_289976 [Tribonema minus]
MASVDNYTQPDAAGAASARARSGLCRRELDPRRVRDMAPPQRAPTLDRRNEGLIPQRLRSLLPPASPAPLLTRRHLPSARRLRKLAAPPPLGPRREPLHPRRVAEWVDGLDGRASTLESGRLVSDRAFSANEYGGAVLSVTPATAAAGAEASLMTLDAGGAATSLLSLRADGVSAEPYLSAPGMAVNGVDLESKLADIDGNLIGLNAATAGSGLVDGIQSAMMASEGIGKLWPKMQGYAELPDYQIPDEFTQGFDPTDMSYGMCEDLVQMTPAGTFTDAAGGLLARAAAAFNINGSCSVSEALSCGYQARFGTDWTPLLAAAQGVGAATAENPWVVQLGNNAQVLYDGTLEAAHVTVEGQVWADEVAAPRVNGVDVARLQHSAAPPRGGRVPAIRSLARGVAAAQRRARRAAGATASDIRARHMLQRLRARFGRGIPASARALTRVAAAASAAARLGARHRAAPASRNPSRELKRMRAQITTSGAPDASRAQLPARDLSREIKRLRNSASGAQTFAAVNCSTLTASGAASVGSLAVASNSRVEMGYSVGAPGTAAGTKLRLYSAGASPDVGDFSIGLASGTMWYNVGVNGTHRWYCNGANTMNLTSAGDLGMTGAFSAAQGLSNIETYAIGDTFTGTTSGANTFHQLSVPAFPVFCNKVTVQVSGYGRISTGSGADSCSVRPYIRWSGTLAKIQAPSFDCKLPRQSDVGYSANFTVTGIFDTTNGTGVNYFAGIEVDCSGSDDSYQIFVRSVLVIQG